MSLLCSHGNLDRFRDRDDLLAVFGNTFKNKESIIVAQRQTERDGSLDR